MEQQDQARPLTSEAYKAYRTSIGGVELKRFLNLNFFIRVSEVLGRQVNEPEMHTFVDFERDDAGNPIRFKCGVCGTTSVAVRWKVPTFRFIEHLQESGNLLDSLKAIELPTFGCFILNPDNELADPIFFCGHAFPEEVKNGNLRHSCLHDLYVQTGRRKEFGYPLEGIRRQQQDIRNEAKRQAEVLAEANRRKEAAAAEAKHRQAERERIEQERMNRVKRFAKSLVSVS